MLRMSLLKVANLTFYTYLASSCAFVDNIPSSLIQGSAGSGWTKAPFTTGFNYDQL